MADVSVQMGVSGVSQFKQGMAQAQASVKSIDAALKLNEKQFKATGDAETYMQNKTTQLNQKLVAQQSAVKNAEQALKAMKDSGVDPLSVSYQKMETQLLNAQSALLDTQNEINNLGAESTDAAGKTDQLVNSLGGLNKKVSLEQVISAIGSITSGMEKAAQKAVELGKQIWENITDSARWADDTATQAMILNMDVETYQRYKGVFDTIGELTVQEWQKAKLKVQKAINDPTKDQTDVLALLGINTHEMLTGKYGVVEGAARDFEDVFWEIGEKLRAKVASGEMTQDLADTYANAIFGRGFAELNPMFALGKEGFAAALEEQTVASEEAIKKDAELNDKLIQLQNSFTALKAEVTSGLAPALTAAADTINQLLQRVMEYLQTPEGQKALEDMGKAVEGLFSDLSKIDPEQVVEGFSGVFNGIVEGLQWLSNNSGTVIEAMKAIVMGWAGIELIGGALKIYQLVTGIAGLAGGGAAAAGAAAGSSWGSAFASAVAKAAPWLLFLYELLKPGETQDNSLVDANGNLTDEGLAMQKQQQAEEERAANRTDRERWLDAMAEKYVGTMGISALNMEMYGHDPIYEAIQDYWDKYRTSTATAEDWQALEGMMDSAKWEQFMQVAKFMYSFDRATEDLPYEAFGFNENFDEWIKENGSGVPIMIDPVVPDDAAGLIAMAIGTVKIPAELVATDANGNLLSTYDVSPDGFNANGLWSVPFDGYRAILHKGERVVPAREVGSSRNFSSNLYVESMYMNNGQDADGLAAAMAAAQRRTMSGYGS